MLVQFFIFIADVFLLNVVFLLSFFLRYGWDIPEITFLPYKDNFPFLTFIYLLSFAFVGVFKKRFPTYWDLFKRIFSGLFVGTLFGIALIYIFRIKWSSFPSSIFLVSFPVGLLIIFSFNGFILKLTGKIKKKVVIIGAENDIEAMECGGAIEKYYVEKIEEILQYDDIDEVVICKQVHGEGQLNLLIYLLLKLKVNVVFEPSIYAELISAAMMEKNSIKFLATSIGKKADWEEFLIRSLDVVGSVVILLLFSPLMFIVSLLIKITSSGPVFYKQVRVAKDGDTFVLYKFKSMIDDAEKQTGPVLASKKDPRITKIGRFLRDTRIDELPQLINVISGKMSLVGPRPERPHFVKNHKALRELRLAVKPGLTGLAQTRKLYDLHPKHKIKYDYLYIQRRSFLLNLYILIKTIPVVLFKKGQ